MVGISVSFWETLFSGAMLVLRRVQLMISWWFISIRPPCIQLVDLGGGNFHSFFFWIFTPKIKLGTWSNLTNTFQMGWFNHQLVMISWWFLILLPPKFDATANAPEKSPGPKRDRIVFQASFFSEHVHFSGCSCLLVHSLKIWFSISFFFRKQGVDVLFTWLQNSFEDFDDRFWDGCL